MYFWQCFQEELHYWCSDQINDLIHWWVQNVNRLLEAVKMGKLRPGWRKWSLKAYTLELCLVLGPFCYHSILLPVHHEVKNHSIAFCSHHYILLRTLGKTIKDRVLWNHELKQNFHLFNYSSQVSFTVLKNETNIITMLMWVSV